MEIVIPTFLWKRSTTLPADCLALPRGDPSVLDDLEDHGSARLSMRMALLPFRLSRTPLPEARLGCTAGLLQSLASLCHDDRKALCGSAKFGVWLVRASNLIERATGRVKATEAAQTPALDEHLARLPLLALSFLFRTGVSIPDPCPASIAADGMSGPAGLAWRLRARRAGSVAVELRLHTHGVSVMHEDRTIIEIPRCALQLRDRGAAIEIRDDRLVYLETPRTAAGGDIEIGSIRDHPELGSDLRDEFSPAEDTPSEIVGPIDGGLATLADLWPEACLEVKHYCRVVVPVCASSDLRLNSTHPSLRFVQMVTVNRGGDLEHAEDLLHEAMHCKLWCWNEVAPLVENEGRALYHHPWRQDARPIMGVFLGAHTFLAIMELYRRAAAMNLRGADRSVTQARLARFRTEVGQALTALEGGARFTSSGRIVMDRMVAAYERSSRGYAPWTAEDRIR
jgi:HEXXH motif-containing protein